LTTEPGTRETQRLQLVAGAPGLHKFLMVGTLGVVVVTFALAASELTLGVFEGDATTRSLATIVTAVVCLSDLVIGRFLARRWVRATQSTDATLAELGAALSPLGLVGLLLATAGVVTAALFVVVGGGFWLLLGVQLLGLYTMWGMRPDAGRIGTLLERDAAARSGT